MSLTADFESHHIEGFAQQALAAGRRADFKVPLISQIDGNLWMGGCKNGVPLEGFAHVISLYPWERYGLVGQATRLLEVKLYDSGDVPPAADLTKLAIYVNEARREGRTLVHCQAGLNRSGLVTALALILSDMDPADAIALLRERRHPVVLCNQAFESWLLSLSPAQETAP